PALSNINDDVSVKVQRQYEENPYPKWVRTAPIGKRVSFNRKMRLHFPLVGFRNLADGRLDMLIAGCGTGQHAIETAQEYIGVRILPIDLSAASLAYAKRKTAELALDNIEYAQADILQLGSLGRRFDVIEASGVLHHLADPFAGWSILLGLLKEDGVMR